ncbi:MAG: UDP-N-acetylmuramoyl-tripeptide--D-alanyl-D-alanine ligase [Proteobacteria bacterium]|nr:UDP-N-acetylmuramoyl-tripeptide--D-alanyl-D-alanine ligase [Pseudomonadota bacterium]MCL2307174.1 UDP-N-acetylmuramoyl-tripeptide--D-alanyl-D-alanine ligase [Pseudomonadota bacterium]
MKEKAMLSLSDVAAMTGGRLLGCDSEVSKVVSDSRTIQAGELFVALKGERFDGHDFVEDVLRTGASALVDDVHAARFHGKPAVAVPDTLEALSALAKRWRKQFTLPVVAVVGSNGKTTVKEMIAAILRAHFGDDAVHATRGNLNNGIGAPLMLLELRKTHRAAVFELGMNHRGETRALASWTQPDVAVINNAQREHQEFMKSVEDVAHEHGDVLEALRPHGCAVINGDDAHRPFWEHKAQGLGRTVCRFGTDENADVRGVFTAEGTGSRIQVFTDQGKVEFHLSLPGQAMAMNALAALAVALTLGVPLATGAAALSSFRAVSGRLSAVSLNARWTLIDDSYNANPDSVRAAVDVLTSRPGGKADERWLVLGDMGEVGEAGAAFHREIGEYARAKGVTRLLTLGTLARHAQAAFGDGAEHFETMETLLDVLRKSLTQHGEASGTVLVKGSRFMQMDKVVTALLDDAQRKGSHAALAH